MFSASEITHENILYWKRSLMYQMSAWADPLENTKTEWRILNIINDLHESLLKFCMNIIWVQSINTRFYYLNIIYTWWVKDQINATMWNMYSEGVELHKFGSSHSVFINRSISTWLELIIIRFIESNITCVCNVHLTAKTFT